MNGIILEAITPQALGPLGTVVDWNEELEHSGKTFHILYRSQEPTGWRLAAQRVSARQLERLANHPDTGELFAPLEGRCAIALAPKGPFDETAVRIFVLDRPVCVAPGVWHGTFALSASGTILIAENLEVSSEAAALSRPIGAVLR